MREQAFCIHGHFYQPPREDPLTGEIPSEPGASPYRNWNERILAQCYLPNSKMGTFEHISFNIGPTLVEWLVKHDPGTLARIVEQSHRNHKRFGVSNALAQPYNHTILPLATREDKITQVLWGIADFEYYFGHKPQGLWLPETAVDDETLEVLAECGIEFTILAPWQAEVEEDFDIKHPYKISLRTGKQIAVFFYNKRISGAISFDPEMTANADRFYTNELLKEFADSSKQKKDNQGVDDSEIVLIATDGELYGHHQPFRDHFLSRLLGDAQKGYSIKDTILSLWLKRHPPEKHIKIKPQTSWSCHHGVKRWSGKCDCTPHSKWKSPLRKALNRLAEEIDAQYLSVVQPLMDNPWKLRNEYIHAIHGKVEAKDLVLSLVKQRPDEETVQRIVILLAAQYERQRMFTSCGWYFDDFNRIEPRNNIAYAAEAARLTRLATGVDLSSQTRSRLKKVVSWRSGLKASSVYKHHLQRARASHSATAFSSSSASSSL